MKLNTLIDLAAELQRLGAEIEAAVTLQRQKVSDFWAEIDLNRQNFELPY